MQQFLETSRWVWVDYGIAGTLLLCGVFGLLRGFMREVLGLVTWFAAILVTMQYSHDFAVFFQAKISYPALRAAVAATLLFIATLIVGGLVTALLNQLLEKSGLSGIDRLAGLGLGLLKGALLISILVMLAGFSHLPEDQWWKESQLIPLFKSPALWLKDLIPSDLTAYINSR